MDLVQRRITQKFKSYRGSRGSQFGGSCDQEDFTSPFVPDIDNFEGTKLIKNYCLSSIKDNGYGFGDESKGVVQLFNKMNGKKIDREDLARIHCLSKFIGAVSVKTMTITNSFT